MQAKAEPGRFPPVDESAQGAATPSATDQPENAATEAEKSKRAQLANAESELRRVTQQEIQDLSARDREVRAHEQAHMAVGGQHAGSVQYDYTRGPDGKLYAVGGEVGIDTAPVPGDPQATIDKMEQVRRAALAPAEPSGQDRTVAAQAAQAIAQARAELATRGPEPSDSAKSEASAQSDESAGEQGDNEAPGTAPDRSRELTLYRDIAGSIDAADQAFSQRA
ncbi:MAG: putative metalloprotease CJM1_0395 family protein [Halopseudomonas sp.]|uniref:putative metalloprotease CJM1_0395 family protein n=1 Tax=Halopseudomonas sp. TaxID=2901191 RepID=UPI003002B664